MEISDQNGMTLLTTPAQPQTAAPPVRSIPHWVVLIAVILCTLLISLRNLRAGHPWGDDFASYILQAKNIADGQPHRPTGYLFNPSVPHVGPPLYPPMVPIILAVTYRIAGLDLQAMKLTLMAVFLISLIPLYFLTYLYLQSPLASGAAVLCFAVNPVIVGMHSAIGSDLVFLPFVFGFLYTVHRAYSQDGRPPRPLKLAVLCGFLIYGAYATRSAGAVLFLVLPATDLLRYRRLSRFTCGALLTAIGLVLLQSAWYESSREEAGILSLFTLSPVHLFKVVRGYLSNSRMFLAIDWRPASLCCYGFVLALAAAGVFYWVRRAPLVLWVFTAGYAAMLALYGATAVRYIIPLLPVLVLMVAGGAAWLTERFPKARVWLMLGLAAYGSASAVALIRADRSPEREGLFDDRLAGIVRYIKENSPPDAVIVFRKPRLMALMTGRRSCAAPPSGLTEFLRSFNPEFVLIADNIEDEDLATQAPLKSAMADRNSRYREVQSIGPYHLFARAVTGEH